MGRIGRSTSHDTRGTRARDLVAALFVFVALVAQPVPAQAHTELVSSVPAAGSTVSMGLDRIELVFGEDLLPTGAAISVEGPAEADVRVGEAGTLGSVTVATVRLAAPGSHLVTYRVVGTDGHVIVGTLRFTAVAGATPEGARTTGLTNALPDVPVERDAPGVLLWMLVATVVVGVGSLHWLRASRGRAPRSSAGRVRASAKDAREPG